MTEVSSQWRNDLICFGLALATIAVYWPVRHFPFVNYDDVSYVVQNPHVRGGLTLRGLAWALTSNYKSNWHPLTWFSHMLDCQFFGLDAGAHHLVNVLFHIASTLLLFHVLNRMTAAPWRSAFVAALFAWHPLHVESVAWVAERKDVLSAFFGMLTLWAYVRYVEGFKVQGSGFCRSPGTSVGAKGLPGRAREGAPTKHRSPLSSFYALTLLFFALGLMAKPIVVTLPFVLLLLDYWPLGRTRWAKPVVREKAEVPFRDLLWEKLPFLPLTVISCILTFRAQNASTGVVASLERLPISDRLGNAVVAYVRYLLKAFWPNELTVFYPYEKWPLGVIAAAAAVLVGILLLAIWTGRRNPHFFVGWLWFLGTLVPVIGLVQVGWQSMADRYSYLPLIGVFIMLAWAIPQRLFERPVPRRATTAIAVVLLGVCAVFCRVQVLYWKDSETLFRHALKVTTNNWLAHYNLGTVLVQEGRMQEALGHFEGDVALMPEDAEGHCSLGNVLLVLGRVPEAVEQLQQAVRLKPDFAEAHNNLGAALLESDNTRDAISHYEQAVRIMPVSAEFRYNLAWALATVPPAEGGDAVRAVALAQALCEGTGSRTATYLDALAAAYAAAHRFNEAIATAQNAIAQARSAGQSHLVNEIEARLQLYRDGRAYCQSTHMTRSQNP